MLLAKGSDALKREGNNRPDRKQWQPTACFITNVTCRLSASEISTSHYGTMAVPYLTLTYHMHRNNSTKYLPTYKHFKPNNITFADELYITTTGLWPCNYIVSNPYLIQVCNKFRQVKQLWLSMEADRPPWIWG